MPNHSQYTAGWIDTTIHDFLSDLEKPSGGMLYALITCLDSSFEVASLAGKNPRLAMLKNRGKTVGKGILLSTRRLLALERQDRIFFGFDELWFFQQAKVSPKPKDVVITGPGRITSATMKQLSDWLQKNGGTLGLGDGTGMNFCARLRGVAKQLVESLAPRVEKVAS